MTGRLELGQGGRMRRLLGLVFAGADVAFEIDGSGRIVFGLGAILSLTGHEQDGFCGLDWRELFAPAETPLLDALPEAVAPGRRAGPMHLALRARPGTAEPLRAALSVFRLPDDDAHLSCTLSRVRSEPTHAIQRDADGFISQACFDEAVADWLGEAEGGGPPLRLDLIEIPDLEAAIAKMDRTAKTAARKRVAAVLRSASFEDLGAAEVAPNRFVLLRDAATSEAEVAQRLERSEPGLAATAMGLPLFPNPRQNLKAMRYALDRFIEEGPDEAAAGFRKVMEQTVKDTVRFREALARGAFRIVYQPVVDLKLQSLHHYEALARFDADTSPGETIRLAEQLGMIVDFDLAVVRIVAKALAAAPAGVSIAVNISANSLMRPGFAEALLAVTEQTPRLRRRLLLEITETGALGDLGAADQIVSKLRSAGHTVCIDDFGAGAASLDYLRRLNVDIVKIDGRYIQDLGPASRDAAILKHVVSLCRELGVVVVAEMIETRRTARHARDLGVDLGQGWFFGKPLAKPITSFGRSWTLAEHKP